MGVVRLPVIRSKSAGRRAGLKALLCLALVVLAGAFTAPASAHPMPDTRVRVAVLDRGVRLDLSIPAERLDMALVATGRVPDPGPGFTRFPDPPPATIARYVTDNLWIGPDAGHRWPLAVTAITPPGDGTTDYAVSVEATAPPGASRAPFRLNYGVVVSHVIPDTAIASLEQDWSAGQLPGEPRLLGHFEAGSPPLLIEPGRPDPARALFGMIRLGASHILEGTDHLAFLLTLLLTVGLVPLGRRWAVVPGQGRPLADTLWRVSAFTAGHTLSLLAASLGLLPRAGAPVEVAIALSVMISAANAMTPLFPRREAYVAGGFGLVHGMAFATVIRDMGLSTGQTVLSTLTFNLGIELVQLVLVGLSLPLLLGLRRTRHETAVRDVLAACAFLAACVWLVIRIKAMIA
jgi:hypothetical protein